MKRIDYKSLLIGITVGAAAVFSIAATGTRAVQMEYKIVEGSVRGGHLESAMNRLSDDWEYVDTEAVGDRNGYAIFRRERR